MTDHRPFYDKSFHVPNCPKWTISVIYVSWSPSKLDNSNIFRGLKMTTHIFIHQTVIMIMIWQSHCSAVIIVTVHPISLPQFSAQISWPLLLRQLWGILQLHNVKVYFTILTYLCEQKSSQKSPLYNQKQVRYSW